MLHRQIEQRIDNYPWIDNSVDREEMLKIIEEEFGKLMDNV